jgi:serine/threonine protein kinase
MGQVYRAHDSILHRDIALKVLPPSFAIDAGRQSRLMREAQVLAALNHPNIAVIYGLEHSTGTLAFAMEIVPGETLAERIAAGPIPAPEVLRIARQIADALEAAHERGIVHRDLKPANIKITPEGVVKVLDFGLAKDLSLEGMQASEAAEPLPLTRDGMVLGTAAYVSPEQARGLSTDRRTDIWAFGVVLFEMLTGTRPFRGHTNADVLTAVIKEEPDLNAIPPAIRDVIGRCLSKDLRHRWAGIGDVRWALDQSLAVRPQDSAASRTRSRYLPWAAAIFATVACAALWLKPRPREPVLRLEITAPEGTTLGPVGLGQLALSPDGSRLAFLATGTDGKRRLWLRSLDSGAVAPLGETENVALYPFWSPDSRWLAFNVNGRLQKIDVGANGPPQLICECATVYASWNSSGAIIFGARDRSIQRVPASGGTPVPVFGFDAARGEIRQGAPDFLPGGTRFLYGSFGNDTACMVGSLINGTRRHLFSVSESPALYAANPAGGGALFYIANGQLFARPFDPNRTEFLADAKLIANAMGDGPAWSASANGLVAFRHKRPNRSELTWFDRAGTRLGALLQPGNLSHPRISPDQKTIAFVGTQGADTDIWLLDTRSRSLTRFTSDPGADDYPVWSQDGNRITYSSTRGAERLIIGRAVNRLEPEVVLSRKRLVTAKYYGVPLLSLLPTAQSPDGRWIAATESFGASSNIWLVPNDGKGEPVRFTEGSDASVSPDGRWMLYASGGGRPEIFVASVPVDAGGSSRFVGRWQISTAGGGNPVWRGDGKEIFYVAPDGKLMSVQIESGETFFRPLPATPLFQTRLMSNLFREYDVSRDGKQFLLAVPSAEDTNEPVTVIVNWPGLLKE